MAFRTSLRAARSLNCAASSSASPIASTSASILRRSAATPFAFQARSYASPAPGGTPPPNEGGSGATTRVLFASIAVVLAAGSFFYFSDSKNILGVGHGPGEANKILGAKHRVTQEATAPRVLSGPATQKDYQEVYNAIADKLESDPEYDGLGHFGPVLVRLAWHASGTYDKNTNSGGSNGATMRFAPESNHGANAGLLVARNYMDDIHKQVSRLLATASSWKSCRGTDVCLDS